VSYAPFDVTPIIARLKSQVPALLTVGGAADYAAVKGLADFRAPCAFVLLAREKLKPHAGQDSQRVVVTFGVVLAVRNNRPAERGAAAASDLSTYLAAIRSALIGWSPAAVGADRRGVQLLQGDLLNYDSSTLLWSDVYQTYQFLTRTTP